MKTDIIAFPNPRFEVVVREALNKPDGDIKKTDAEKIASLESPPLTRNLTGLEHFIKLEELRCDSNPPGIIFEFDIAALREKTTKERQYYIARYGRED